MELVREPLGARSAADGPAPTPGLPGTPNAHRAPAQLPLTQDLPPVLQVVLCPGGWTEGGGATSAPVAGPGCPHPGLSCWKCLINRTQRQAGQSVAALSSVWAGRTPASEALRGDPAL
ncbi:unnamed protein product, partial [Gulo gulo]